MKNPMKTLVAAILMVGVLGMPVQLFAQDADAPAVKEETEKRPRSLPFNGTLKAIDKKAGTVTVSSRTFKLTPKTRYLQDSLDEAKIGEKVGGSYFKMDDGSLVVNSIRFGPKEDKEATTTDE